MSAHTPAPWAVVTFPDGSFQIWGREHDGVEWMIAERHAGRPLANAERIVACVNACHGIDPEAVPRMVAVLEVVASLDPEGVGGRGDGSGSAGANRSAQAARYRNAVEAAREVLARGDVGGVSGDRAVPGG